MGKYWILEFESGDLGQGVKNNLSSIPNGTPFCSGPLHWNVEQDVWVCWSISTESDTFVERICRCFPGIISAIPTKITEQIMFPGNTLPLRDDEHFIKIMQYIFGPYVPHLNL